MLNSSLFHDLSNLMFIIKLHLSADALDWASDLAHSTHTGEDTSPLLLAPFALLVLNF
jgi:hypothetical protein